jgi:hypothetical protein
MVRHSAAKAARYMKSLEPALDTIRNRALTLASNPDKDSITALAALLRTDYARILGIQQSTPATFHEIQEALQRQFPDHPSNSDRLTAIRTILNAADALKYAAPGTPPPIEDWKALAIKAFADHPSTSTDPSHA